MSEKNIEDITTEECAEEYNKYEDSVFKRFIENYNYGFSSEEGFQMKKANIMRREKLYEEINAEMKLLPTPILQIIREFIFGFNYYQNHEEEEDLMIENHSINDSKPII